MNVLPMGYWGWGGTWRNRCADARLNRLAVTRVDARLDNRGLRFKRRCL
jgi:hypothetical protein